MAYVIQPGERLPRQEIDAMFSELDTFRFETKPKKILVDDLFPDKPYTESKTKQAGFLTEIVKEPPKDFFYRSDDRLIKSPIPPNDRVPIASSRLFDFKTALGKLKTRLKEEIVKREIEERAIKTWHYLAMSAGAGLLVEVRPEKCFFRNERLADKLIIYNKAERTYGLDTNLLKRYLDEHTDCKVQVHLPDLLFDPETGDYELFSITTGDLGKAGIFLELARFLAEYNKGTKTVLPVHLPYFEKWPTKRGVKIFGSLSEDGKRDAVINADKVLRFLLERWPENVILALETGSGKVVKNEFLSYALIYELPYLQFLTRGRSNVAICEDVGHLNLIDADWADYLIERIAEFHVSGNDGKNDVHSVATPKTLKCYHELMSFLKFYSGVVCAEIKHGGLSLKDYIDALKELALSIFSLPTEQDFNKLMLLEQRLKEKFPESEGIEKTNLNKYYDLYSERKAENLD